MMTRTLLLTVTLLCAGCAADPAPPAITVTDAWARATAPGQSTGAVYLTITNRGGADRLVAVDSAGGSAMLHHNAQEQGVARMRTLAELAIPAGSSVTLAPGGTHIMLGGLAAPLVAGQSLPLTLRFAAAGPRRVDVAVVVPGAR